MIASIIIAFMTLFCQNFNQLPTYNPEYTVSYDTINGVGAIASLPDSYDPKIENKFVIFFHGNSGPSKMLWDHEYVRSINVELLKAGYVVIGSDYSLVQNWGNPQSVKETKELIDFYQAKYNLEDQPYVYLSSMGGLTGLNSITQGVIKPKAVIGLFPAINLRYLQQNKFVDQIDLAYGIKYGDSPGNKLDGYDPLSDNDGNLFKDIPFKIWSSKDDTIIEHQHHTQAFSDKINAIGGNVEVIEVTGEHGDLSHYRPKDVVKFFDKY
ncbi:hypothetical protein BBD42_16870 [Paenibacillus sp. BIHB 4019]|uniref:Alpha/beta hydrolase n=1 Tax=Paenibacillus sp. BIHB 4019 TaxID=1870819 RepID=A0A1B2DJQ5_9BACL|nr:hypothetical protein [Paenibacillus sp. BIHB 4019]ANY67960.1 hypothetical protein BBD42_16870 [Paenibacillus sp. BIHB 4019]